MNQGRSTWVLAAVASALVALLVVRGGGGGALEGEPAPAFSLPVVYDPVGPPEGARIRLEDLKGQVVLLDFWASWCGPCRASVPALGRLSRKYRDRGVQLVGINSEALDGVQLRSVATRWGFAYPVVSDGIAAAAAAYGVDAYPTLALVDREGVVRRVYSGDPGEAALSREIEKLLE